MKAERDRVLWAKASRMVEWISATAPQLASPTKAHLETRNEYGSLLSPLHAFDACASETSALYDERSTIRLTVGWGLC